jgi:hypothetical protein
LEANEALRAFSKSMRYSFSAFAVMVAFAGCADRRPTQCLPQTRPEVRTVGSAEPAGPTLGAPAPGAGGARAEVIGERGCERAFPAIDTTWVENVSFVTRLHDAQGLPSFMIADRTETTSGKTEYRVLSATGSEITVLQVTPDPDPSSGGAPSRIIQRRAGDEIADSAVPPGRESLLVSLDRFHVTRGGLGATLANGRGGWAKNARAADVERALAPLLGDVVGWDPKIEVRYAGPRDGGGFRTETFLLRVKGERGEAAMCHGRRDRRDLRGELVLRSQDLVLLSLDLTGRDDIVEDICSANGLRRDVVGKHVADSELHIRARCFARAVKPLR